MCRPGVVGHELTGHASMNVPFDPFSQGWEVIFHGDRFGHSFVWDMQCQTFVVLQLDHHFDELLRQHYLRREQCFTVFIPEAQEHPLFESKVFWHRFLYLVTVFILILQLH